MEKQKTAMGQLKERLEILSKEFGKSSLIPDIAHKKALDEVIKHIDSQMMAIEKGIIKDAYFVGTMRQFQGGDHYYNQTFEK